MSPLKLTTLSLVLLGTVSFSACDGTNPGLGGSGGSVPASGGSSSSSGGGVNQGTGGSDGDTVGPGLGGESSGGFNGDPISIGSACTSDEQCEASDALCDPSTRACVACITAADCGEGSDCFGNTFQPYTACESSLQCGSDEVCSKASSRCVECEGDNDCSDEQICLRGKCATNCSSDKDCTPNGQVCDTAAAACTDCLTHADCGEGKRCVSGTCFEAVCAAEQGACRGDVLLSCKDDGTGYSSTTCNQGCNSSELVCGEGGDGDDDGVCAPRLRILVQRSGIMFEYPSAEENWWGAIEQALDNSGSDLLDKYSESIDLSLSTFHSAANQETCPLLATKSNLDANSLKDFFSSQAEEHEAYVDDATKVDAPLPDAIKQAVAELGEGGDRYVLLIISGLPDSCAIQDGQCAIGPAIAEVQAAYAAGIKTKLIYLTTQNATYPNYPEGLANAGIGQGVADLHTGCESEAEFSESPGNAAFANPSAPGGVKDVLASLLADIERCN